MVDYPLYVVDTHAQIAHGWFARISISSSFSSWGMYSRYKILEKSSKVLSVQSQSKTFSQSTHLEIVLSNAYQKTN